VSNRYTKLGKDVWRSVFGTKRQRYEAHHDLLTVVSGRLSHKVYNKHLAWMQDEEFESQWRRYPETTKGIGDRKYSLYQLARSVRDIAGDTAECGCWRGAGSFLILAAQGDARKTHHIFDSFEGLSTPAETDIVDDERTYQWKAGDLAAGEDVVRANLREFDNVFYYRGWIPARFDDVADRIFSFVHVDVDLYEPTLASVEFFYPRIRRGGLIVCDDYGHLPCPGAMRAMDEYFADKPENVVHLTTGQGVIWKQ
jgi:O-methyltransferase